ncbi:MAG: S8 family serine peptidase [Hymenobacter sp.]
MPLRQLGKPGITVVVSAGNDGRNDVAGTKGYGTISSPGNSPYAITVGATRTMYTMSRGDDLIASYSSKGPSRYDHIVKPDLVAPGNQVVSLMTSSTLAAQALVNNSLVPLSYYQQNSSSNLFSQDYYKLSGTSMAAPVVSGAVALLLNREPSLTPDQLKARLMKTASKSFPAQSTVFDPVTNQTFVSHYDVFTVGAGYLDIWAALNNRATVQGTAMSPRAVFDATTGKVEIIRSEPNSWSNSGAYGLSAVWGDSVFVGEQLRRMGRLCRLGRFRGMGR